MISAAQKNNEWTYDTNDPVYRCLAGPERMGWVELVTRIDWSSRCLPPPTNSPLNAAVCIVTFVNAASSRSQPRYNSHQASALDATVVDFVQEHQRHRRRRPHFSESISRSPLTHLHTPPFHPKPNLLPSRSTLGVEGSIEVIIASPPPLTLRPHPQASTTNNNADTPRTNPATYSPDYRLFRCCPIRRHRRSSPTDMSFRP
jgi:hypothetical protein